jgi:FkbM family methyltransferase
MALDIGASWGLYTFVFHLCGCAVVAFEPNPEKATYLKSVFGKKVDVHAVALSDHSGNADLVIPSSSSALATIEPNNPVYVGGDAKIMKVTVPLRQLDDYEFRNVGFIKIDVEGHEMAVLSGGRQLIQRDKPVLFIEIERRHNKEQFDRVFEFLAGLGYTAFYCDNEKVSHLRYFDVDQDQRVTPDDAALSKRYVSNFLFFPPGTVENCVKALRSAKLSVTE